jgi:hypothetical protein
VLDAFRDRVAQLVEVIGLHLDDDVVRAGYGVDADDLGVRVLEGEQGVSDALGPADLGFDETYPRTDISKPSCYSSAAGVA